jgi:hypothetical protein
MTDAKQKWDEVGERFGQFGRHLKERYDAQATFGEADKAKLNDALHQIGESLDAGFTALGDSLRDPAMRADLKDAGAAIADALSSTFKDVADELKKAVKRDGS